MRLRDIINGNETTLAHEQRDVFERIGFMEHVPPHKGNALGAAYYVVGLIPVAERRITGTDAARGTPYLRGVEPLTPFQTIALWYVGETPVFAGMAVSNGEDALMFSRDKGVVSFNPEALLTRKVSELYGETRVKYFDRKSLSAEETASFLAWRSPFY